MDNIILSIQKYYNNNIDKLAKDLGITKEYWYMIKSGKRKPSDKLIFEISKKVNINFEELYIFFANSYNK